MASDRDENQDRQVARQAAAARIRAIVEGWERDGTIGDSRPATRLEAVRQAVAIAAAEVRHVARNDPSAPPPSRTH